MLRVGRSDIMKLIGRSIGQRAGLFSTNDVVIA